MKRLLVLAMVMGLLSGCYKPTWHRENTTYSQLKSDSDSCKESVNIGSSRDETIKQYEQCMQGKGYMLKSTNQTVSASIPSDVQIVQPDPSLPKELTAFFGKWEVKTGWAEYLLIVENIDEKKASLYTWNSRLGWERYEAKVTKENGKYKLWFSSRRGIIELTLSGEYLDFYVPPTGTFRGRRVS